MKKYTKNEVKNKIIETITKDVLIDESMSKHTTFKIGGKADIYVKLNSIDDIVKIIKLAKNLEYKFKIIGNGSNLLVRDNGIDGIVGKNCADSFEFIDQEKIRVDAGMSNAKLSKILLDKGLTGFEFAGGIPGTIGGALKMNAGAYGCEMKDIVLSTRYIDMNDENLEIKEITNIEHEFSYRHSCFSNNCIILDTILKFTKGDKEKINELMKVNMQNRLEKQPLDKPSAGSSFKRGDGFITAKLIDECGLKGYRVGDAQVSQKHAGFIVNLGNATAKDVMELVKIIKKKIYEKFQKEIELEIEIIGR